MMGDHLFFFIHHFVLFEVFSVSMYYLFRNSESFSFPFLFLRLRRENHVNSSTLGSS